jgi:hypothetical protein
VASSPSTAGRSPPPTCGSSAPRTSYTVAPTPTGIAGATGTGFYVSGGVANLGTLRIGTSNSSASTRVDGGALTVTGRVTVGQTSNTRYSVLHVNGGTFTSTDPVDGVVLSAPTARPLTTQNSSSPAAPRTSRRSPFGLATDTVGGNGFLIVNGANANLYVGAGGITQPNVATPPTVNDPNILVPLYVQYHLPHERAPWAHRRLGLPAPHAAQWHEFSPSRPPMPPTSRTTSH